jgi:hypothetical protein
MKARRGTPVAVSPRTTKTTRTRTTTTATKATTKGMRERRS